MNKKLELAINDFGSNIGEEEGFKMAEALMTALKPEKFCVSRKGDPDTLLTEFNEYVKKFERFVKACNLDQGHVPGDDGAHVGCNTCGRLVLCLNVWARMKFRYFSSILARLKMGTVG